MAKNPGLLDIFWPLLVEEPDGKREVLLWKPHGFGGSPLGLIDVHRWVSDEREMLRNRRRYFQITNVTLGVSTTVEIGRRSMHAWELDVGRGLRKAYVDPDGVVLRVDLERTPDRSRQRWIRLVFPSEY